MPNATVPLASSDRAAVSTVSIHVDDEVVKSVKPEKSAQPGFFMKILPALACTLADQYGLGIVQPLLQFQLRDEAGLSEDDVTRWVGLIVMSQYVGVLFGCLVMGYVCDKLGPMRALQMNIVGDIVFFAATGFFDTPEGLLIIRLFAGFFSPLVPGVAHIFATTLPAQTVQAMSFQGLSVVIGMGSGNASVGLIEGPMSFKAICIMCAGLATIALATTAPPPLCPFNEKPKGTFEVKPEPEGVKKALRSRTFLTQLSTAFCGFFYLAGSQILIFLDLVQRFDFSATLLGPVLVSAPLWLVLAFFVVPRLAGRYGLQPLITFGFSFIILGSTCLAIPTVNNNYWSLLIFWSVSNIGFSTCLIPINVRAKMIGVHQTRNGTGQITGLSKVAQSLAQVFSPLVVEELLRRDATYPWIAFGSIALLGLFIPPLMGISLLKDPDWTQFAIPPKEDEPELSLREEFPPALASVQVPPEFSPTSRKDGVTASVKLANKVGRFVKASMANGAAGGDVYVRATM